ncbi:PREDICTED: protein YLS9-like [Nelumbo nucifera]|uniref:Protein YLS9-like n=1 Tax=Nelumbo nucifera TaxID=4432 RepID=A0A1U8A796_NELNU|nr:PREDICTED: protein YLS9-like [Nelumbo nucifera]
MAERPCFCVLLIFLGELILLWKFLPPTGVVKYHLHKPHLVEFSVSKDNILRYNFTFHITFEKPNKRVSVYYDQIEAETYYHGVTLGNATFGPFYQGDTDTDLHAVLHGNSTDQLGQSSIIEEFNREEKEGTLTVVVKLYIWNRLLTSCFTIGPMEVEKINNQKLFHQMKRKKRVAKKARIGSPQSSAKPRLP